jgi:hypothetical protein
MIRTLFNDLLIQNRLSCQFAFNELTSENIQYKLTNQAASAGFIYRHIGETMILFGYFFGFPPAIPNTTMGATDIGQGDQLEESHELVEKGYTLLKSIIDDSSDSDWQNEIETPFFGRVTKARLFSHVLYHTAYHAGQISLTLKKGSAQK